MHKRYLWIDRRGADIYWPAVGNVDISATGQGTIGYWVRSQPVSGGLFWDEHKLWRIWIDSSNYVASWYTRSAIVSSDGTTYNYWTDDINRDNRTNGWEFQVTTWNFNTGILKSYYNDAVAVNDPLTGVPAPQGTAARIYLGPTYGDTPNEYKFNLQFYMLGIWDEEMSESQISALYAQGHLHRFRQADGPGNLTLLLAFDNGLDADIAAGDGSWAQADGCSSDRFCLMDDGIRELGRASYPLGVPRHDLSEDDRKPLNAVCPVILEHESQRDATSDINETNYSRLIIDGYDSNRDAGARFPTIPQPGTYRQLIHIPDDSDYTPPNGYEMGIGPVAYKFYHGASSGVFDGMGSGRQFKVVADGGNTTSSFKTDIFSDGGWPDEDDYWVGARLTFFTGNCTGRSLYVTAYDSATKFITVETGFPAVPSTNSSGLVNFHPRVFGQNYNVGELERSYAMEANLWAHHNDSKHFVELEWQQPPGCDRHNNSVPLLRYERGRSVKMPGSSRYYSSSGVGACYGKWNGDDGYYNQPGGTNLEIWLRQIEMDAPQRYQILRKDARGRGPALADNFTVLTRSRSGGAGESVKVWQQQDLTLSIQRPTKIDWSDAKSDLQQAGTWRETVLRPPFPVEYDEANEVITVVLIGADSGGTGRVGYVQGQWDDQTGRISWEDEPAPSGKTNPFLEASQLRGGKYQDSPSTVIGQNGIFILPATDGTWSLIYSAAPDGMDGTRTYALHGAPDRWSFDEAVHDGLFLPGEGGVDMHNPITGHGITSWANTDIFGPILFNPYAEDTSRRYLALIRAKTIFNECRYYSTDLRPLVTYTGADVRSLSPLPHGNSITPIVSHIAHTLGGLILGQEDSIGLLIDGSGGSTSGLGLYTSEDGVHFQELFPTTNNEEAFIPPHSYPRHSLQPGGAFRLGDKRIYYYYARGTDDFSYGWIRYNGESYYALSESQTAGFLETAILEKPPAGWQNLYLNLELNEGQSSVEIIDPQTELPVAGYGSEDCDDLTSGLEGEITWQAASLSELTHDWLRLRFHFSRSGAEDSSPQLYAWEMKPAVIYSPSASDLRVEGEVNPTNVLDTTPTFSWTYQHPQDSGQSAYQIIVASSPELLAENTGDLWDSGIVLSSQTAATYAGTTLEGYTTYFWKVRVRSAEGVWSEQW